MKIWIRTNKILALLLLAALLFAKPAIAQDFVPLRAKDVLYISQKIGVEFSAMVLILHQEHGCVGLKQYSPKTNTYDYGPFQINSCHLDDPEFKAAGLTADVLQYNGPLNALAAAFLLRKALIEADQALSSTSDYDALQIYLEAIGRYHSKTPDLKSTYQQNLIQRLQSFDLQKTFEEANRPPQNN